MAISTIEEEDQEPFLGKEDSGNFQGATYRRSLKTPWVLTKISLLSILIHIGLLVLWKSSWQQHSNTSFERSQASKFYSPFENVISKKIENWEKDAWDNSIFLGEPSEELDLAWDKLQAVEGISVSPEESAKVNLTSDIRLKNGDQAVVVGYFHNLHCLRYLYQGLHPETYVRSGGDPSHGGLHHSYHCLEVLRRSVLCNPDLTLHAIHWQTEEKLGMTLRPESTRQCVDFQAIYDFSMTRRFARNMIVDVEDSVYDYQ
ncbi:hypothetical protein GLAREA_01272 [Glarea lozoyensis ATCC 20868]|uniref:Cyclochlorotine biosynthesis protein O n=1 Tax=Glarea lozoyensis (strain ATCC 20868 / MF5171) TaxID=1116229 RepID=S3CHN7_GLAL2|nr:uncharacterized protein GLAREA_01272 [Glarea lozoyensis ATCC 20868]EPE25360.1 hypothetical protein GLAREA_01272 [Glarea lozoyensis ATCC 20868]